MKLAIFAVGASLAARYQPMESRRQRRSYVKGEC